MPLPAVPGKAAVPIRPAARDRRRIAAPISNLTTGAGTDRLLQLALLALLAFGAWRVVEPFLPAVLFSLVIASCGWPIYNALRRLLFGHEAPAALLACALALVCVLLPALLLLLGLADGAQALLGVMGDGTPLALMPLPAGLQRLPLIGPDLAQAWDGFRQDPNTLKRILGYAAGPARDVALVSGRALANAAVQAGLSALLLYFFFRNGEQLARGLHAATDRLCGRRGRELVQVARASVSGVMFGELGAGMAQGAVATLGFLLAGVPNPFLLGAVTFILSIIPIGPPLIWAGASLWLVHAGEGGWALFMVLYGVFVISTIDNVLKPLLISRASRLPFVFALVGVFGGVLGFGAVGVFLGPTLLALAADLATHWLRPEAPATAEETTPP